MSGAIFSFVRTGQNRTRLIRLNTFWFKVINNSILPRLNTCLARIHPGFPYFYRGFIKSNRGKNKNLFFFNWLVDSTFWHNQLGFKPLFNFIVVPFNRGTIKTRCFPHLYQVVYNKIPLGIP